MTGFSQTKVNRCLAEGRERFRAFLGRSESGGRCAEMRPVLSAFCDGEASAEEADALREHLRVCAHCRAAMRAYRAVPGAVSVLAPVPIVARPLLERAHDALLGLASRLPGREAALADSSASQVAVAGGARGAGGAALAKLLAICAGTAGSAAVCVSAGVVPAPVDLAPDKAVRPHVRPAPERPAPEPRPIPAPAAAPDPEPAAAAAPEPQPVEAEPPEAAPPPQVASGTAAVSVPSEPADPAASADADAGGTGAASAAGEFGP